MEYYTHTEALASMRYVSGTKLDERIIRCDLDLGYKEGRQFGRGKSGGQVRDEHRQDYDPGRGGWGAQAQRLEIERRREVEERYADAQDGPGAVAGGGEDWKQENNTSSEKKLKRGRSPEDEDNERSVSKTILSNSMVLSFFSLYRVNEQKSTKTQKQKGCSFLFWTHIFKCSTMLCTYYLIYLSIPIHIGRRARVALNKLFQLLQ